MKPVNQIPHILIQFLNLFPPTYFKPSDRDLLCRLSFALDVTGDIKMPVRSIFWNIAKTRLDKLVTVCLFVLCLIANVGQLDDPSILGYFIETDKSDVFADLFETTIR